MPIYEVLLDDWGEIRLTGEPLNVGTHVEIEKTDWLVVGVAKTPSTTFVTSASAATGEGGTARRNRPRSTPKRTMRRRTLTYGRARAARGRLPCVHPMDKSRPTNTTPQYTPPLLRELGGSHRSRRRMASIWARSTAAPTPSG